MFLKPANSCLLLERYIVGVSGTYILSAIKNLAVATDSSLKREVVLIIVGAVISASTAFFTDSFNERRENKRINIQKKLELNDQISRDLGKRLYLTFDLYRKRRDKDTTLAATFSQYKQTKEEWNLKIYSYQSLLNYYYGQSVQEEFLKKVYNPLVLYGQSAEYNRATNSFEEKYSVLRGNNVAFITRIYSLTED